MSCTCTAIKNAHSFCNIVYVADVTLSVVQRLIMMMCTHWILVFSMQDSRKSFIRSTTCVAVVMVCLTP